MPILENKMRSRSALESRLKSICGYCPVRKSDKIKIAGFELALVGRQTRAVVG
jgi:hypothetical protein